MKKTLMLIVAVLLLFAALIIPVWTAGSMHQDYGVISYENQYFWLMVRNFVLSVLAGSINFYAAMFIIALAERN